MTNEVCKKYCPKYKNCDESRVKSCKIYKEIIDEHSLNEINNE